MFAFQVALALVLALAALQFLPFILAAALFSGFVALIAILATLIWFSYENVAIYVGAVGFVGLMYGIPFWLKSLLIRKYPALNLLINGAAPYDKTVNQPLRIFVMICLALLVASIGVGTMLSGVYLVDVLSQIFSNGDTSK